MDVEELRKDLAEIKEISAKATRKRVQDALSLAQKKIETDIIKLEEEIRIKQANITNTATNASNSSSMTSLENKTYVVDLNEYAWDQSDKFVKLFVTLDGVQKLRAIDVQTDFNPNSLVLTVKNLNNREYRLTINNLLYPIDTLKSYHKIKTDMVAVYMKKDAEAEKWSHLTLTEKRLNDIKDSKFKIGESDDMKDDPSAGIMNLMKRMYETGDPEMKRMIAKAWTENKDKQNKGMPLNFD